MAEYQTPTPTARPALPEKHRKQVFWQIIFPLLVALALIAFVAVLATRFTLQASVAGANPASAAAIFLIAPLMVIGLFFLAVLVLFVVGITRAKSSLPGLAGRILGYFKYAQEMLTQISNQSAQPVINIKSRAAALRHFFQKISGKKQP